MRMLPTRFIQNTVSLEFCTRMRDSTGSVLAGRDPHQVTVEVVEGVGLYTVVEVFHLVFDRRAEEGPISRGSSNAKRSTPPLQCVLPPRISRGAFFFEHHDAFGPVLPWRRPRQPGRRCRRRRR